MVHKRVIVLGPTGVGKRVALNKAKAAAGQQLGRDLNIVDFEKDLMPITQLYNGWSGFLYGDISFQTYVWREAWDILLKQLKPEDEEQIPTILSIHGAYVRGDEGVRSVIDLQSICRDFRPTLIITLIDDVYNMWWRTEDRADGEDIKGRPTLEQLILARRSEVTIGDLISCQALLPNKLKHVVLSVHHPIDVFLELLYFDSNVSYLSFPISAPRELIKKDNDFSFYNLINDFHQKTLNEFHSRSRPKNVFVSPLAIDELPLCNAIDETILRLQIENSEDAQQKTKNDSDKNHSVNEINEIVEFDPEGKRWPITELWGGEETLSDVPPPRRPIPLQQAKNVIGLIRTDVGWRDYKLVRQAHSLGVFCPKPPNRENISRGVEAELLAAIQSGSDKAIYVWQNPEWDLQDIVGSRFGRPGSMDQSAMHRATTLVSDVDEFVRRMLN